MNRSQRRQMERLADRENATWPGTLQPISVGPALAVQMVRPPERAWRSRHYLVMEFLDPCQAGWAADGKIRRLSVQRVEHAHWRGDRQERSISWDDLQRCKRECGYGDAWAVEVYPPDEDVVCLTMMRHLWLVPDIWTLAFAWRKGRSGKSGLQAGELLAPTAMAPEGIG